MKKTIFIINQYAASPDLGMELRHYYLALELTKIGHQVYIVAATYTHLRNKIPNTSKNVLIEKRAGVNFIWIRVPRYKNAHSKLRLWNWVSFAWKISRLMNKLPNRPDVVLYSSPSLIGYLGAEKLARTFRATLVFEVRDIWPLTLCQVGGLSPKNPLIQFMQWIEDRAYRNSDIVISNLKNSVNHMILHGLLEEKFHWIPNGYSKYEVANNIALSNEMNKALLDGKFTVGYTGTLGASNCLNVLIRAACLLKDNDLIKFVIVGQGKERESLKSLVKREKLNNVVFMDPIQKNQVQSILTCFNVLYIGLKSEPLFKYGVSPNKLFDYLYAGKPIIYGIDSGDYHPILDSGAGLEIPPENAEQLAQAILKLFRMTPSERKQMGDNGRRLAVMEYEYSSLAAKLASVLFYSSSENRFQNSISI